MFTRTTSESLDKILYKDTSVLDKGFIRVIDYMGNDQAIVQAARVSYGNGTKTYSKDKALISYLMKYDHTTPFEMCEIKFHIKMPFFVARQWIRHRTANINEYSGRYSIIKDDFYLPEISHIASQSKVNKQGRDSKSLEHTKALEVKTIMQNLAIQSYKKYQELLNKFGSEEGIARELARVILTLNYYTEMYWKIDLHNLLHFLKLRSVENAQYEIKEYALKMLNIVKLWVPYTYDAFLNYKLKNINLSKAQIETLAYFTKNTKKKENIFHLNKREWKELSDIFF